MCSVSSSLLMVLLSWVMRISFSFSLMMHSKTDFWTLWLKPSHILAIFLSRCSSFFVFVEISWQTSISIFLSADIGRVGVEVSL